MNNEYIFLLHLILLLGSTYAAFFIDRVLLQALICIQVVSANIFIVRQMSLCGLTACGGGMYIVSSGFGLLLLQTFYSKQIAHRTLYLSFALTVFFLVLTRFQLWYVPAPVDTMHETFFLLLARVPFITLASLIAHFCAHYLTLLLQRLLISATKGRWLFFVSTASLLIGQICDSVLFFGGAFWGYAPLSEIAQMVSVSLLIKGSMILVSAWLLRFTYYLQGRRGD